MQEESKGVKQGFQKAGEAFGYGGCTEQQKRQQKNLHRHKKKKKDVDEDDDE